MQLTITSVDYAPDELYGQTPFVADLIREVPGSDRPDYWLAALPQALRWNDGGVQREVSHVVLAARWAGTEIAPGVQHLPVSIAYVLDQSVLRDARLEFAKTKYVAIGIAEDTTGGRKPEPLTQVLSGNIRPLFGVGKPT